MNGSKENTQPSETQDIESLRMGKLKYLESTIDFEQGVDRGPLSEKTVLVYSPPKCGTVSLTNAISAWLRKYRGVTRPERRLLHNHENSWLLDVLRLPQNVAKEEVKRRVIIRDLHDYKRMTNGRLKIISSFRDPLERALSLQFNYVQDKLITQNGMTTQDISFQRCYERLFRVINKVPQTPHSLEEIDPGFFQRYSFNQAAKACYVNEGNCEILVLTSDHSDRWQEVIEQTLGYTGLRLVRCNVSTKKEIGEIYRAFKEQLRLPRPLIESIYYGPNALGNSLRWFYTESELEQRFTNALQKYGAS